MLVVTGENGIKINCQVHTWAIMSSWTQWHRHRKSIGFMWYHYTMYIGLGEVGYNTTPLSKNTVSANIKHSKYFH